LAIPYSPIRLFAYSSRLFVNAGINA
jgi:hypothetical protein